MSDTRSLKQLIQEDSDLLQDWTLKVDTRTLDSSSPIEVFHESEVLLWEAQPCSFEVHELILLLIRL
jgi:hypothetical protein